MVRTNKRKFIIASATAALVLGVWSIATPEREIEDARLLANHIWVDRMPDGERDMIRYFVALRSSQGRVGAAGRASSWRQFSNFFLWRLERDRIALYFGQDDVRWRPKIRTWRCEGEAPEGFELCLRIWDDRHEVNLYSRDDWEIDPGNLDALPEELASLPLAPERFDGVRRAGAAPEGAVDESVGALEAPDSLHFIF